MSASPETPSTRNGIAVDAVYAAAAIAAIASLLIRDFYEPDIWWHLAIGKDILNSLSIPSVDRFTLAGWGRPYHDSHWLFQVLVASAERVGGLVAVGLVPAVTWSVTLYACYRAIRAWAVPAVALIVACIVALGCSYRFIPRPDILTCLMISVYYLLLQQGRFRTIPQILLFGCLQIIWSNSHGLFVIGPFMAACYLAEAAWDRMRGRSVQVLPAFRLMVILLLATFCTPFPLDGWQYALQLAQEAGSEADLIYSTLDELAPVFGKKMMFRPEFWVFLVMLVAFFAAAVRRALRGRLPVARALLVVGLLCAALTGRRNIPLFVLSAAPLVAEIAFVARHSISFSTKAKLASAVVLTVFTWFAVSGRFYHSFGYDPVRFGIGSPSHVMPSGLPMLLKQTGFSGQIYNHDRFGGYCLYHGVLPLVDGRWEVYDPPTLSAILTAPFDDFLWNAVVNRYGITGALLENGVPETNALIRRFMQDGSFHMVYSDAVSSFWIRSTSPR